MSNEIILAFISMLAAPFVVEWLKGRLAAHRATLESEDKREERETDEGRAIRLELREENRQLRDRYERREQDLLKRIERMEALLEEERQRNLDLTIKYTVVMEELKDLRERVNNGDGGKGP